MTDVLLLCVAIRKSGETRCGMSKSVLSRISPYTNLNADFLMVCKNCGANIPNGELFCPNCGTCTENAKFCKYCGAVIGADCVVCPACGRQVEPLQSAQQPQPVYVNNNVTYGGVAKSKWAAFFLCLFLGLIGAHKFYEGKIGMGVLYIFTGGLFGIGAFVDLIVILCKPGPYYYV